MPKKPIIDKEMFKRSVLYNVKTLYRKTLEEATDQQIFQAVAFAVKITGSRHRKRMRRRTPRQSTICRWSF